MHLIWLDGDIEYLSVSPVLVWKVLRWKVLSSGSMKVCASNENL